MILILEMCSLADSRFNYNQKQLAFWTKEIEANLTMFTLNDLEFIVKKGLRGGYEMKSNHIAMITIFDWARQEWHLRNPKEVKLPKNWIDAELTEQQFNLLTKEQKEEKLRNDTRRKMGV